MEKELNKKEKERKLVVKLQLHVKKVIEGELQKTIEEKQEKEAEIKELRG